MGGGYKGVSEVFDMSHLISIVVPVYNVEPFIRRAIESVINQSYQNWELILVDDGSPDQCGLICDEYASKDSRIHVIHQKNKGVSSARNAGLQICHGDYLLFLDPDDYLVAGCLIKMLTIMENDHLDILMEGHNIRLPGGMEKRADLDRRDSDDSKEIQRAILLDHIPNFPCGKMYVMHLWENMKFPEGLTMEDLYLIPEIFYKAKRIRVRNDPVFVYNQENEYSIMKASGLSFIRHHYGKFQAWKRHEELAEIYDPEMASFCARKTIHEGIRAFMLDDGMNKLTPKEKEVIVAYLDHHKTVSVSSGLSIGRSLILHNYHGLISLLGMLQRKIIFHQQMRRAKRFSCLREREK